MRIKLSVIEYIVELLILNPAQIFERYMNLFRIDDIYLLLNTFFYPQKFTIHEKSISEL
jgi:hypothetical protein